MTTTLVSGGTGLVGSHLAHTLDRRGDELRLRRKGSSRPNVICSVPAAVRGTAGAAWGAVGPIHSRARLPLAQPLRTVEHWSGEHILALIATAVGAALLVAGARRWGDAWAVPAGRGLALVILSGFVCEQLTYALRGQWTAEVNLPLQLTDAVTLVSVAALWRPESALLVELVYFWALSASLQAVLTPDLGQSSPDLLFFTYFATHSGAVAAACLLVFGARRAPRPDAVWRVYAITVAFTGLAAVGTLLTDGNYMFLRHKPAHGSLLDFMGPWPVYIIAAALLAAVMFLALAALARFISAGVNDHEAAGLRE